MRHRRSDHDCRRRRNRLGAAAAFGPGFALQLEDVSFAFGTRTVLSRFSATFPAQAVTALVGPSGSGKSTLLAAMAGYLPPTAGRVFVTDADGSELPPNPGLIAWVPQGANALGARTVLDNIAIAPLASGAGLNQAQAAASDALAHVGLADRAGDLARDLSGGELQRVGFARALASGRPIVFADEPTSSLDETNTLMVAELLNSLIAQAVVVVATHDPVLIAAATREVDLRSSAHV